MRVRSAVATRQPVGEAPRLLLPLRVRVSSASRCCGVAAVDERPRHRSIVCELCLEGATLFAEGRREVGDALPGASRLQLRAQVEADVLEADARAMLSLEGAPPRAAEGAARVIVPGGRPVAQAGAAEAQRGDLGGGEDGERVTATAVASVPPSGRERVALGAGGATLDVDLRQGLVHRLPELAEPLGPGLLLRAPPRRLRAVAGFEPGELIPPAPWPAETLAQSFEGHEPHEGTVPPRWGPRTPRREGCAESSPRVLGAT